MKVLIGNFKGPKGDTGGKGDKGNKGDRGEPGQRGSRWTSGTGITGTSTTGVKFPNSGITDAQLSDYYINTSTGNLYECTVTGAADTAEWVYIGSFKGPKGDAGPAGSISDINNQKPTYLEASKLENIESGETVNVTFGKLKKAVSVLISHYMQKATQSIIGHVKLSDSAAITIPGEYALDAIEKNASVEGTLANMISQTNSNLATASDIIEQDLDNIKYRLCLFRWGKVVFINGSIQFKKAEYYVDHIPSEYIPIEHIKAVIMDVTANVILTNTCFIINSGNSDWSVTNPSWDGTALPEIDHECTFVCTYIAKN